MLKPQLARVAEPAPGNLLTWEEAQRNHSLTRPNGKARTAWPSSVPPMVHRSLSTKAPVSMPQWPLQTLCRHAGIGSSH